MLLNPCNIFDQITNVTDEENWTIKANQFCELAYENKVLKMLRRECLTSAQVNILGYQNRNLKSRNRRVILLLVGIVGGILSYSVLGFLHHFDDSAM